MNLSLDGITEYFMEVAKSTKIQISAAFTLVVPLYLIWHGDKDYAKLTVTILFLFPTSMLIIFLLEKICFGISSYIKRRKQWNSLTPEEIKFISYYITKNTQTRYVSARYGTYSDSGIINGLIVKEILYMASNISEFREGGQTLPFNITDRAFSFFKKKLKKPDV